MTSAPTPATRTTAQSRQYEHEKIIEGWGNLQTPYSQEAEEATIGAILVNSATYHIVAPFLKPDDFFILRHRYIWEAIGRLDAREEPIDYLTVTKELKDMGKLSEIGGPAYLTQLLGSVADSTHAEVYGRLVEKAAGRRRLMAVSDEIKALAMDESITFDEGYLASVTKLDAIAPNEKINIVPGRDSIQTFNDMQYQTTMRIEAGEMVVFPLPPEMGELTQLVPCFSPGDFVVISGDSGSGKSCALEQIGEGMAAQGIASEYMHTEMSTKQVLQRRMARHSGIPYGLLETAGHTPAQRGYTTDQRAKLDQADEHIAIFAPKLTYTSIPDVNWNELKLRLRRRAAAGVKVFLIDHFQDITMPNGGREENTVRMFEKACIWLAAFAEKRQVVVIVASQENKQGKTKWTTKLKEKAVCLISFKREVLYAEYAYVIDGVEVRAFPGEEHPIAKAIVAKARFGKKGVAKLLNHGPRFRWLDPSVARRRIDYPLLRNLGKDMAAGEEIPQ